MNLGNLFGLSSSFKSKWTRTVILVIFGQILISCGSLSPLKKRKKSARPDMPVFVHGDPMAVIAGTVQNKKSFVNTDNIEEFKGFDLLAGLTFVQFTPDEKVERERPSVEAGNEATTTDEWTERKNKQWKDWEFKQTDRGYVYHSKTHENSSEFEFVWQVNESKELELKEMSGLPVTVIHYSYNPQKRLFSVLLYAQQETTGVAIFSLNFGKSQDTPSTPELTDTKYNYFGGPGVKVSWDGDLKLQLCGGGYSDEQMVATNSLNAWAKNGKIGQRLFTFDSKPSATPFSDVNTSCILWIDAYLYKAATDTNVLGKVLATVDLNSYRVLTSTIFLFNAPMQKYYGKSWRKAKLFDHVVQHEFGHWLGLDHEFDKGADGTALNRSVMSYESGVAIQPHDFDAVAQLYGAYDK